MEISLCAILYNNIENFKKLLGKVIIPTIEYYKNYSFKLVFIDNSRYQTDIDCSHPFTYIWFGGENRHYAGAINEALGVMSSQYFVYLCSNHCNMTDPTWLEDLIEPFNDELVAMTGYFALSVLHFVQDYGEDVHVQGGLFAARTSVLKSIKYDLRYPHMFSDVWISNKLKKTGYKLASVPTVCSVWRHRISNPELYKLTHDER